MADLLVTAVIGSEPHASQFPWLLHVGEITQPLRRLVPVEGQYRVDRLTLRLRQLARIARWPSGQVVLSPVQVVEFPHDWPVHPSLDLLREKRLFVPDETPSLGVIHELLELHGRHPALLAQNVSGNIVYGRHDPCTSAIF